MIVKFKKLHPDAIVPTKATEGSACYDVYALEHTRIRQGQTVLVRTGIAVEIPRGYFIEIRPRSGLSYNGMTLFNAPGTLDSDYRGELMVMLHNFYYQHPFDAECVERSHRIAQLRLVKEEPIEFSETQELSATERGAGGFGSTGK